MGGLPVTEVSAGESGKDGKSDGKLAGQIRETLLREEFGFSPEDIAKYDEITNKKGFYISDDKSPERAATAKEIGNWETKGGNVKINVKVTKADELRDFRFKRILDKSLDGMKDPILRESVREDLLKIYKAESSEKITAADRLIGLNVDHDNTAIIHNAIRKLSGQKETQNNAVLQITVAKIDLAEMKSTQFQIQNKFIQSEKSTPNVLDKLAVRQDADGLKPTTPKNTAGLLLNEPGWTNAFEETKDLRNKISDYKLNLERTTRTAGGFNKITGTRLPNAKVDNKEAIWVNSQAARAYREIGDVAEAEKREMMVRYYQTNDAERKQNMMFISRTKVNTMSPTSTQKLELTEIKRNQAALKVKDMEEAPERRQYFRERIIEGKTETVLEESTQVQGSLKPLESQHKVKGFIHLDKNGNPLPEGLPYNNVSSR